MFSGIYGLRQLNESSTASQEHDPTGSVSNNCCTIDIPKWCFGISTVLRNIFSLQQLTESSIVFGLASNIITQCLSHSFRRLTCRTVLSIVRRSTFQNEYRLLQFLSVFTWPFSGMFDDCQFLMFYLQFIFSQFILTIIIFIIMKSVNPSRLLLSHSSASLYPALPRFLNCLYHCYLYRSLQTWRL